LKGRKNALCNSYNRFFEQYTANLSYFYHLFCSHKNKTNKNKIHCNHNVQDYLKPMKNLQYNILLLCKFCVKCFFLPATDIFCLFSWSIIKQREQNKLHVQSDIKLTEVWRCIVTSTAVNKQKWFKSYFRQNSIFSQLIKVTHSSHIFKYNLLNYCTPVVINVLITSTVLKFLLCL
jgi:hypothetical protein